MPLIDKVREAQEESFDKWFDRFWKKSDLEKNIVSFAEQGYKATHIEIQGENEVLDTKKAYRARRLRDLRTVEKIQEKLGEGFKVKHEVESKTYRNFFTEGSHTKESDYILISWGKE